MKSQSQTQRETAAAISRKRDLAKIHIAIKQLGVDDSTYREMLFNIAGVKSAADLNGRGRAAVVRHLRRCGFKTSPKKSRGYKSAHKSAKASGMHKQSSPDRAPLLSKIGAILADLGLPWDYADGMAKHMFRVDKTRWLYPDQLHKLTAALIYHQKRTYERKEADLSK